MSWAGSMRSRRLQMQSHDSPSACRWRIGEKLGRARCTLGGWARGDGICRGSAREAKSARHPWALRAAVVERRCV